MLMSSQMLRMAKIMYVVSQACWSWYTFHVQKIKTPMQNLKHLVKTHNSWQIDQHLKDTIRDSLYNESNLRFMGMHIGDNSPAMRRAVQATLSLMLTLLGHRAWSMAARHSVPPEAYAGILSSRQDLRETAMLELKGTDCARPLGSASDACIYQVCIVLLGKDSLHIEVMCMCVGGRAGGRV